MYCSLLGNYSRFRFSIHRILERNDTILQQTILYSWNSYQSIKTFVYISQLFRKKSSFNPHRTDSAYRKRIDNIIEKNIYHFCPGTAKRNTEANVTLPDLSFSASVNNQLYQLSIMVLKVIHENHNVYSTYNNTNHTLLIVSYTH